MNTAQFVAELRKAGVDIDPKDVRPLSYWRGRGAFPSTTLGQFKFLVWFDDSDQDFDSWCIDRPESLGGYGDEYYRSAAGLVDAALNAERIALAIRAG
jgi:hypothetical protein